jgi:glutamine synthetase
MRDFDVPLEGLHTETGPGVYEAAIMADDALEAADRAVLFKGGAKEIANKFGYTASFMARWNTKLPGCSGHIHQSLRNAEGANLFHDAGDPLRMSKLFRSYLAGQMRCLPEILPMFAPTVNSYKRLVEGYWAPTRVTWGKDNRTVCMRVIPGSEKSTRLELRVGGADINPYLAVAAAIAAGLYGIENNLQLTEPMVEGNGYAAGEAVRLSRNLDEATEKFAASRIARELFGDKFVDHYANTRRWEWRESLKAVTDWELKRYFEII